MAEPTRSHMGTAPTALRVSPAAHLAEAMRAAAVTGERGVTLVERPFVPMVNLRVTLDTAAAARVEKALGVALPRLCGETAVSDAATVLWLGPDEWLVLPTAEEGVPGRELGEAIDGDPGSVVDVSANRTTLEIRGPAARAVLETGCPLDLHPRAFGPGRAVSTTVGPVPLLLWQVDSAPTYRLMPRASFADHLVRRLIDAMDEFRGPRHA